MMENETKDYYALYDELYYLLGRISLINRLSENLQLKKTDVLEGIQQTKKENIPKAKVHAAKIKSEELEWQDFEIRSLQQRIRSKKYTIEVQSNEDDLEDYEVRELHRFKREVLELGKRLTAMQTSYLQLLDKDLDYKFYIKKDWVLEQSLEDITEQEKAYELQLSIMHESLQALETQHGVIIEKVDGTYVSAGDAASAFIKKRRQKASDNLKQILSSLDQEIKTEFEKEKVTDFLETQDRYQTLFEKHYKDCNITRKAVLYNLCVKKAKTQAIKDFDKDQADRQAAQEQAKSKDRKAVRKEISHDKRANLKAHFSSIQEQYATIPKKTAPIRLKYKDSIGGMVKNTRVVCWQYVGDTDMPTIYSQSPGRVHSVFHAKTDEYGFLRGIRDLMHAPKDVRSKYMSYSMSNNALHTFSVNIHKRKASPMQSGSDTRLFSLMDNDHLLTLEIGTRYGFMVVPTDCDFKTDDLMGLATSDHENAPESGPVGTIHTIEGGQGIMQSVDVYCTLPGWTVRIKNVVQEIRLWQKRYQKTVEHRVRDLSSLNEMQQCADINLKFPGTEISKGELKEREELPLALDVMRSHINDLLETPDEFHSSEHKGYEDQVNRLARKLMKMLNSDELQKEFLRYQDYVVSQLEDGIEPDGDIDIAGPDMVLEVNWQYFFTVLQEALGILGTTKQRDEVEKTWVKPALEYVGSQGHFKEVDLGEFPSLAKDEKLPMFEGVALDLGAYGEVSYQGAATLPTQIMGAWHALSENKALADVLFHRLPGPPSLMMVMLDVYGAYVSRYMYQNQGSTAGFNMRVLINGLGYLMGKPFLEKRTVLVQHLLVRNLRLTVMTGNIKLTANIESSLRVAAEKSQKYIADIIGNGSTAESFYDQAKKGFGKDSLKRIATGYSGSVALLGLVGRVSALQGLAELDEQLRQNPENQRPLLTGINIVLGAASASANTYSFMVNRTVAGGKLHQNLTSLAGISVSKGGIANFCDRFAHVLGYFAALDAALMAEEAYNSARYETATKELLNSASLVALTLGSQLLARGGIVMVAGFIPGVGVALLVAGILVQVAIVTWDLWIDQLKSSIQVRYSKAYRVLQDSPYISEYEGKSHWQRVAYPGLQRPMELLMENDEYTGPLGIWDTLSWHAVIPLYLQQRDNQLPKTEQIETVTKYVDLDEKLVTQLIQYYESSETLQSEKPMEKLPNGIYLKEMLSALSGGDYSPHPENHPTGILAQPEFRTIATLSGPKFRN